MRNITIEVDDQVAKAFWEASPEYKAKLNSMINLMLKASSISSSKSQSYIGFLTDLRDKMEQKGLSEEELKNILKDE